MLLFCQTASADFSFWNLRRGVTEISREVYDLHMLIFYICCVIGVIVFGAMIVSMILHRKSLGVKKGQKIPASKLNKAAKKGGKLGQRARLAKTLKGFKK